MSELPEAFRQDEPQSTAEAEGLPEVDPSRCAAQRNCDPLVQQLLKLEAVATKNESDNESDAARGRGDAMKKSLRIVALAAHFESQRHLAELAAMRDVIQCELTDREANAARVAERQQVLNDRADGPGVAFERAVQAAEAIEEMMLGLELQSMHKSQECGRLLAMDLFEQA